MLTRLEVQGFKNLRNVDVPFGPFTCIAGANAVGKSNLFDAIQFLSDLASYSIVEAAARVRDPGGRIPDLRSLFTRTTNSIVSIMSFGAEFVVPNLVIDDFGRQAKPSATFLRYEVRFRLVEGSHSREDRIELEYESLDYIRKGKAKVRLGFPHSKEFFSIIEQNRTRPLISSDTMDGEPIIKLHQDKGTGGRLAFTVQARNSPRTIVGATNTTAEPTVLAARREMQSWISLQLEPTALRKPDDFGAASKVSPSGEHLPSTLHRLGCPAGLATDLAELLPDVREVLIDSDEGRRLRTLKVAGRDGLEYAARSLSDGTLRFLALAAMRYDPEFTGLICFEEPENGLHPSRIPAMLRLLEDIAVNPFESVDTDNPLRQVVINTHSPVVVQNLPLDTLMFAKGVSGKSGEETIFQCLPGAWRSIGDAPMDNAPLGDLLPYLVGSMNARAQADDSSRQSVLAFAAKQAELDFVFKDQ
jgi:predicted ATPase